MKKKVFIILTGMLVITLAFAGVVGAQALPDLLLEEEKLETTGYVDEFEMGYLIVDGTSYVIMEDTEIEEEIVVGDFVKVKYYEGDEGFVALEVELEDEEFDEFEAEGYVEEYAMGEYIIIDGVRYDLTMDTEIEEEIEAGDFVKVMYYEDEGLFIALEVELEDDDMDDDTDDDMDDGTVCSGEFNQPALERLAMSFGVDYDELLPYFCDYDFGIGEIFLMLETIARSEEELTPEDILTMRMDEELGWGEIWQSLGLIGRGKHGEDSEETEETEAFARNEKRQKFNRQTVNEGEDGELKNGNKPETPPGRDKGNNSNKPANPPGRNKDKGHPGNGKRP